MKNLDTHLRLGVAVFHPGQTDYFHSLSMNLTSSSKEDESTKAHTAYTDDNFMKSPM